MNQLQLYFYRFFNQYLNQFEHDLRDFIKNAENRPVYLYNMIQYHMGWLDENFKQTEGSGGKRLRPLLLLLCCDALGGQWHHAMPAAIAVECLHNFTLIHDDIEDRDEMRHGRPTIWSIWGIPQAINAGDALYTLAFKALFNLAINKVKVDNILSIAQIYSDAVLRITEGQCQDIGFESIHQVFENQYLDMIAGKTAALFGLSCELAAIIAGTGKEKQQLLKDFGFNLGMAFQMQDDILGLWGNPHDTGKPVGSDLLKAKKTLPIIHCAQNNAGFLPLSGKTINRNEFEQAMQLLKQTGSYEYTEKKVNAYLEAALQSLDLAIPSLHQSNIRILVSSLLQRQQ